MLLSAFRRFQNFQRRHGLEFNVAGAATGLVTGTILAVGFLTRSDATPAPAPHGIGWLTGPVLALIHDGGI
ncbi:MAG TPA: hypothetical protein VLG36_00845 [Candidatus Chromulinivoraceae bacterium]|nr:hypothetical protein [Candidatus Chromulinivoraceae bacterium]